MLDRFEFKREELPAGYELWPWKSSLVESHAAVKYVSFRGELDGMIFPSLGSAHGCRRLMKDIVIQEGFVPNATWLATYQSQGMRDPEACGTIQGVMKSPEFGTIQNLGVTRSHRRKRLARALLVESLLGFRELGIRSVFLEVTAENFGAVKLYQELGFRITRTLFKEVVKKPKKATTI